MKRLPINILATFGGWILCNIIARDLALYVRKFAVFALAWVLSHTVDEEADRTAYEMWMATKAHGYEDN